jgi:hypothetical protein
MVRSNLRGANGRVERPFAAPAHEQPVRQSRSTTPAIAIPKPTHIVAIP